MAYVFPDQVEEKIMELPCKIYFFLFIFLNTSPNLNLQISLQLKGKVLTDPNKLLDLAN